MSKEAGTKASSTPRSDRPIGRPRRHVSVVSLPPASTQTLTHACMHALDRCDHLDIGTLDTFVTTLQAGHLVGVLWRTNAADLDHLVRPVGHKRQVVVVPHLCEQVVRPHRRRRAVPAKDVGVRMCRVVCAGDERALACRPERREVLLERAERATGRSGCLIYPRSVLRGRDERVDLGLVAAELLLQEPL